MKIDKKIIAAFFSLTLFVSSPSFSESLTDTHLAFEKLFRDWSIRFNNKDLAGSCSLFSKSVVANYEGAPTKNYTTICNGFKKIFDQKTLNYRYRFKLHNVYQSNNLAAVRISWYLYSYENDQEKLITQDEGMDILEKNKAGQWKIMNYLAYEAKKSK